MNWTDSSDTQYEMYQKLPDILQELGYHYQMHNPDSWPCVYCSVYEQNT
jgi:hypothetical protein